MDMDSPVNLVADMSSDIMSRPVDVSKYALIYGGAQKNVGPGRVLLLLSCVKISSEKLPVTFLQCWTTLELTFRKNQCLTLPCFLNLVI